MSKPASETVQPTAPAVLVVDDISTNLLFMETLLQDISGLRVISADSGRLALEILEQENDVAVVLLDVQMPQMDGFETLEAMRKVPRLANLPVIFVTAAAFEPYLKVKGIRSGAVDFITKPINEDILLGKLNVFLRLHAQERELRETNRQLSQKIEELENTQTIVVEKNRFLTSIMESLSHPFYVLDLSEGRVEYANAACQNFDGFFLRRWEVRQDSLERLELMRQASKPSVRHLELEWEGSALTFELHGQPIRDKEGNTVKFIEYAIDTTPESLARHKLQNYHRELEQIVEQRTAELVEARDKAEQANRLKTAFLQNISHEVRTPLNAVSGYSGLMASGEYDFQTQQRFALEIETNLNALLRLFDDIIELSRVEAGEVSFAKERIEMKRFFVQLEQKALEIRRQENRAEIGFSIHHLVDDALAQGIRNDVKWVRHVLGLLISNAFKFTEQGRVEVGVCAHDDVYLQFYVRDTGIGIEQEKQRVIFDRFRKIDEGVRLFRGIGLGLTLSKKVAQSLGGDLWLHHSDPSHGSEFRFSVLREA